MITDDTIPTDFGAPLDIWYCVMVLCFVVYIFRGPWLKARFK